MRGASTNSISLQELLTSHWDSCSPSAKWEPLQPLLTDPKFHASLTLSSNNSPLKSPTPKKYHIFEIVRTWAFTWWYPGYGFHYQKPKKIGQTQKNAVFCIFWWHSVKKFQMAANRTILILEGLPTAHLKAYVPNFPKHPWESRKSLKLRELCPSKVRWSRFVSLKNAVFSALFWRKSFFWPTSTKATTHMIGIFGKLCISAFCTYPNIRVFLNRQAVRILLTLPDWLDHISSQNYTRLGGFWSSFGGFSAVFGRLSASFWAAHRTNKNLPKIFITGFHPPLC